MSFVLKWLQKLPSTYTGNTIDLQYVPKPEIALDSSGNIYVVYVNTTPLVTTAGQTNVGGLDICIVKFDTNGTMLWYQQQPSFDTSLDDIEPDLAVDANGNVYVTYCTGGIASGQVKDGLTDIVVFKLDTNGNTLWVIQEKEFNTLGGDYSPTIALDDDGGVYVSFWAEDPNSPTTYYEYIVLFKLDTNGNIIWVSKTPTANYNTPGGNYYPSIGTDADDNVYVSFWADGSPASGQTNVGQYDIVVFKTNMNGQLLWIRENASFDTTAINYNPELFVTPTGTLYIAYYTLGGTASGQTFTGSVDIIVFKMDTNGNVLWIRQNSTFNTTLSEIYPSIFVDVNDMIYVTYETYGTLPGQTSTGNPDVAIMRMDNNGNVLSVIQQASYNTTAKNLSPTIVADGKGSYMVSYYSQLTQGTTITQTLVVFKMSNLVCVGENTLITMADGTTKPIQTIHRGDLISPNSRVAKVCQLNLHPQSCISLMIFEERCLGFVPTHKLVITPNHPIFYQEARRPAICFQHCPGVTYHQEVLLEQIPESPKVLYDLQFEHDGSYIANGLEIQSRSPFSIHDPLPKELYYDPTLYQESRVWDHLTLDCPLKTDDLHMNVVILKKNKSHPTSSSSSSIITKYH